MAVKKPPAKNPSKKKGLGVPQLKYPGDIGYDAISGVDINPDLLNPTDTTFNYDPIKAQEISADQVTAGSVSAGSLANRFMTTADYTLIDPADVSNQFGDIARGQATSNSKLASQLGLDALNTELQGLEAFTPRASALKRTQIGLDNTFNQQQRDAQLAQGDPRLRSDLESQAQRGRDYASGRLPDSINDRALELGIRSSAADAASSGGFGVSSSAARKASDLLSAQQRVGLSQYGDQLLSSNISARNSLLLAPTQYSDAGAQINVNPTKSAGQYALEIGDQLNDKTIISSTDALTNLTQQSQYQTSNQQETNKFNTGLAAERDLNQANLNLQADTTNVGNTLQANLANQSANLTASQTNADSNFRAQATNQAAAIQTQTVGIQTRSNEGQFNAQLSFNAKNANADRTFQAANINAGRSLEVASSNRATKLDIQKTNKTFVFQDQQARKAEAGANARAAISARASSANAQLSYQAQKDAIAANLEAQKQAQAFSITQQDKATAAYQAGLDKTNAAQNAASAGQIIAKVPTVIAGTSATIDALAGIYGSTFGGGDTSTYEYNSDYSSLTGNTTSNPDFSGGFSPDFGTQYA